MDRSLEHGMKEAARRKRHEVFPVLPTHVLASLALFSSGKNKGLVTKSRSLFLKHCLDKRPKPTPGLRKIEPTIGFRFPVD